MKFALVSNPLKDPALEYTKKVEEEIKSLGSECFVVHSASALKEEVDVILVLGGDGTVLRAARETAGRNIPMIGINLGTLGYLSEIEINDVREAIKKIMDGEYDCEERMMLSGEVCSGNAIKRISPALNDVVITRSGPLQIITLKIYVNGKMLCTWKADGIIISTPTGSTGYNMSAGGPIVEPGAELILITPICAHTLNAKSIVLSADDIIEVEVTLGNAQSKQAVEASSDGTGRNTVESGDRIKIYRAKETTTFLKLSKLCFLEVLHKKMEDVM